MSGQLYLGLDLGGTKIAAGVVSGSGKLFSLVRVATPAHGVRSDLRALFDAAQATLAAARIGWPKVKAVGVGVPGAVDPRTETVWAPNLPGWKSVPLRRLLERALGRPVFIEADRNVQAMAEAWVGAGKGASDLIVLTVGTGIGAGIISSGRVVSGSRGVGGAAGWIAVTDRWQPAFARLGSLEAQAAGPTMVRAARLALRTQKRGVLARLARADRKLTGETLVRAARQGDARARRILAEAGEHLGRGVASMVALLNPELVIIGGGLAEAGDWLLAPLRRAAKKWGQPLASRQVRIMRTRLGADIGVLGAARCAMLEMEREKKSNVDFRSNQAG